MSSVYPNSTTSWYSSTYDPNITLPTSTVTRNTTKEALVSKFVQYCWITPEMDEAGFDEEDLPAGCQSLLDKYCYPTDVDGPMPTSPGHIPAACTPSTDPDL